MDNNINNINIIVIEYNDSDDDDGHMDLSYQVNSDMVQVENKWLDNMIEKEKEKQLQKLQQQQLQRPKHH